MAGAVIGALRAALSLDTAAFEAGAKRAEAVQGEIERSMRRHGTNLQRMGRTYAAALSAPILGLSTVAVKSALATVDAQAKLAQSFGTTTASVQVLARAADLAGVSFGEVQQAGVQLAKRLSEVAATGGGQAAKALDQLRLSGEELQRLPLDERIARINDALGRYVPEAERASVATQLFGSRAGVMFTRIDSATLRLAADDVARFGVAVSEVDADQIEVTNDAISRLGLAAKGLGNQIAVALAPTLEQIADAAARAAEWFAGLSEKTKGLIATVTALAAGFGPAALALGAALKLAAPLAGAFAAMVSPIGLAAAAIVAVGTASAVWSRSARDARAFSEAHELAMDNVTIAMGDQINATARLTDALRNGGPVTLAAIEAARLEAEARQAVIDKIRKQREEAMLAQLGYGELLVEIQKARAGLDEKAKPTDKDLVEMPALMAAGYEAAERNLVRLLKKQAEMLETVRSSNLLTQEEQDNREQINANLAELEARQNRLNGIIAESVSLTDRGAVAADGLGESLDAAATQAARVKGYLSALPGALDGAAGKVAGLEAAISVLAGGGDELSASVAKYRAELVASLPPLENMVDGQRRAVLDGIDSQVQLFEQGERLNAQYQDMLSGLRDVARAGGAASTSALSGLVVEIDRRRALIGVTDEQRAKLLALREVQQKLGAEAAGLSEKQIEALAGELVELDRMEGALARVEDQQRRWAEQITRTAFEGGSLTDTIKGMLRDIAYQFANSKIVLPVTASITGLLGGDGIAGAAGQLASDAEGGTGFLSNAASAVSLATGAFGSGIGIGVGNLLSGGIGSYVGGLGAQAGVIFAEGFSASAAAGLAGMSLAGLGLVAGGALLVSKAFGRSWSNSGVEGSFGAGGGFEGQAFDFYKGGWLRSDKTTYSALDSELDAALDQQFSALQSGLGSMSDALGLATEKLATYQGEVFKIYMKGLSEQEIQEKYAEQLDIAANGMADLVLGTSEFARVGESASETLTRLGGSLITVNDAFDLLGRRQLNQSQYGGNRASEVLDAFGGSEQFSAAVNGYFAAFYSEGEQLETLSRRLSEQFADINLTMPETREGFRALVDAQKLNTAEGRETYAALLGLAGAFDQVQSAADTAAEAVRQERGGLRTQLLQLQGNTDRLRARELAGLDASNRALQERIWALQDEQAETAAAAQAAKDAATAQAKLLSVLRGGVSSALSAVSTAVDKEVSRIEADAQPDLDYWGDLLSDANDQAEAARSAISGFIDGIQSSAVDAFRQMRDQIRGVLEARGGLTLDQQAQDYRAAQQVLEQMASGALGLSSTRLDAALSGIGGDTSRFFSSRADYLLDAKRTDAALRGVEGRAGAQMSAGEQQVARLNALYGVNSAGFASLEAAQSALATSLASAEQAQAQILSLEGLRDDQIDAVKDQLTLAQEQVDAALGTQSAVLSVADAIGALTTAIGSLASFEDSLPQWQQRAIAIEAGEGDRGPLWEYEKRILDSNRADLTPWQQGQYDWLKLHSYSGGGYTGPGPRTGGVDGEGGRLAIIHPDETVIDHHGSTRRLGSVAGQGVSGLREDMRGYFTELLSRFGDLQRSARAQERLLRTIETNTYEKAA